MCGILSIFVQYFRVQKIHLETRRKINLCSDELNGGPFSHRLIFCWYSSIGSNYWLNQCWEIRIDPFLMAEAKLFRLRREIDTRIEPVLLEESNDKSGFLEEILKTGEVIYNADQAP